MADNLIRAKQIYQPEISGLVQNVISSNEYELLYNGGTGLTISEVSLITVTGSQINLINNTINFSGSIITGNFNSRSLISGNIVLSNFPVAPANPIRGQLFFDTVNSNFSGYNGTTWVRLNN